MRPILCLLAALAVSGCALTTDEIDVPYVPGGARAAAPGASAVTVAVSATDARTSYRDRVSTKRNGYGMEMAPIVATNNVIETLRSAVAQELTAEGFRVGPGGLEIAVEVVKFYSDFKTGFFSGDALAEVTLNLTLLRPDKSVLFTKYYAGSGKTANIQLASGSNARAALVPALTDVVQRVAEDPELMAALLGDKARPVAEPRGLPSQPPPSVAAPAGGPAGASISAPVVRGDGSCLYKPTHAGHAPQRIENGDTFTELPNRRADIPLSFRCKDGQLTRITS